MAVGKVIVITGAGAGLGRALARRFAKDGDTVVLLGRTLSKVQAVADELGAQHLALSCDVGNPDSVRAAFAAIRERHAAIDVLINNAAYYQPTPIREVPDAAIDTMLRTNLAGPIYTAREAVGMMGRGGLIINLSSESVKEPYALMSLYQSTKMGLERFTEALAQELAEDGIRVCLVRAAAMADDGAVASESGGTWDPGLAMKLYQANLKIGRTMGADPMTEVSHVADLFHALVNLPDDITVPHISLGSRHP
jgi:meso-butanediol dehydrogenase / (S,S)-butanediol dehydrogenase / diacetyl reductase